MVQTWCVSPVSFLPKLIANGVAQATHDIATKKRLGQYTDTGLTNAYVRVVKYCWIVQVRSPCTSFGRTDQTWRTPCFWKTKVSVKVFDIANNVVKWSWKKRSILRQLRTMSSRWNQVLRAEMMSKWPTLMSWIDMWVGGRTAFLRVSNKTNKVNLNRWWTPLCWSNVTQRRCNAFDCGDYTMSTHSYDNTSHTQCLHFRTKKKLDDLYWHQDWRQGNVVNKVRHDNKVVTKRSRTTWGEQVGDNSVHLFETCCHYTVFVRFHS